MKTETCKLYSRVLRIFLPNVIKIELGATSFQSWCFFLRHSVWCWWELICSLRGFRWP